MEKFGWAFIGAGEIANYAAKKIFTGDSRHRLVSVYNRTRQKAEKLTRRFGGAVCETLDEAVNSDGVDGVYISTTTNNHYESAKKVLSSGKPVLVEKPITVNSLETEELALLAKEKNIYICEAMWTWFSKQSVKIKEIVQSGGLGKITGCYISFCIPIKKKKRLTDINLGGGALLDLGVYPVAYSYNLFGYPKEVFCSAEMSGGVDLEDDITLTYEGLKVTIEISAKGFKKGAFEKLIITGDNGIIKAPFFHKGEGFRLISPGGNLRQKSGGTMKNQFDIAANEINSLKKESDFVPVGNSVQVMKILDECRKQIGLKYPFEKVKSQKAEINNIFDI